MNEKYKTLELLKQSEYADVYTISGETDDPKGLCRASDRKLHYFGCETDYNKEYIILLPKDTKEVANLYKMQEVNKWKFIDWLTCNAPECEDPFDDKRIQPFIDLVGALYIHVRVLTPEEKKQLWREFNKENLQFYHDWNEIYQGREEGPEMDKNYGFRHYFFCQEHNVSWEQLLRTENDQAVIAYMQFFEKHRNLLDILKNR